jgi:hypothetical protein
MFVLALAVDANEVLGAVGHGVHERVLDDPHLSRREVHAEITPDVLALTTDEVVEDVVGFLELVGREPTGIDVGHAATLDDLNNNQSGIHSSTWR